MLQWDQRSLGSAGMQVRSLAWLSGLRIWHCCTCALSRDCGSDLIPGRGTAYAVGRPKKEKNSNGEQKASQLLAMAFRLWKSARCIYGKNELMLGCRRSIERVKKNSKLGYQGAQLMS